MDQRANLLFGILARQLTAVPSVVLSECAVAWLADPSRDIPDRLLGSGALDARTVRFVNDVLARLLEEHGGDSAATLDYLGASERVRQTYEGRIVLLDSGDVMAGEAPINLRDSDVELATPGVQEAPGRYTQPSVYATGGMGRVLLVHDEYFGRDIALKELLPPWSTESQTVQPGTPLRLAMPQIVRFLQEARITGQLEHPAIVPVYEVGRRSDGTLYYTMKLVRGKTLGRAIRDAGSLRGRLQLLTHLLDLCHAIAYAHARGVIHRDIKPSNVMVGEFGETVVIDWGLAKVRNKTDIHADEMAEMIRLMRCGEAPPAAHTLHGDVVGTPVYMSPEQARSDINAIDERSDVYALGAALYELLTGEAPFESDEIDVILRRVLGEAPLAALSRVPDAPRELVAICERAMHKEPGARYQSAKALAEDLQRFLSGAMVQAYEYSFAEYLKRFVARHKAILATAGAGLAALIVVGVAYNVQLVNARNREHDQRVAAETANKQLVWENYAVTLGAVQRHIADGSNIAYGRALALLDQSPLEHRNWEWGLLRHQCQPEAWQLFDSDTSDHTYGMPCRVLFSPDQRYILCYRFNSGLKHIFSFQTGKNIYAEKVGAYNGWPECTQFSPGSRCFTSAIDQTHVGLWDFYERKQVATFDGGAGEIHSVAFSPDGRTLAGFVLGERQTADVVVWDVQSGAVRNRFSLDTIEGPVSSKPDADKIQERYFTLLRGAVLGFFPDGKRVVFTDNKLGILDLATGARTYLTPYNFQARFSPSSAKAAVCNADGAVEVWDLDKQSRVAITERPIPGLRDMALSPDGKLLVTSDGGLQGWDAATGKWLSSSPHVCVFVEL